VQPKLCQRACKANAPREIVLKNLPTLKKIKNSDTRANTEKQQSKMIGKLNIDNGLQDWKTEHQAVTGGIFYCRDSGSFSVSASNKLLCNLTEKCFEIGNKNIPPIRCGQLGRLRGQSRISGKI
jgi:hypothetical protein